MKPQLEAEVGSSQSLVVNIEVIASKVRSGEVRAGEAAPVSGLTAEDLREMRSLLAPQRITFGRSASADIEFSEAEAYVSTLHMVMEPIPSGYVLRDAGSRNGIFLITRNDSVRVSELDIGIGDPPVEVALGPAGPRCRIGIGEVIPFADYLVTGQLGEGGMATVFLAQETIGLSRLVVLKLIAPSLLLNLDQKEAEKMLQEEARIASQIAHPNVVNIYRAGCHDGTPFIAMEYLRGVSLSSILRQLRDAGARCPYELASVLISQVCRGLHAAHEAQDATGRSLGIVHRDCTPSNIICSPAGDVKLIDFGVARALGRNHHSASGFVGKPAYASPEQIRQPKQLTRQSDLFSVGVILHELCSGRPLFWRESDFATMAAVINDPIPSIPNLPPAMGSLLQRLLSRDPAQRPATAVELAEELEQIVLNAGGGMHLQRKAVCQTLRRLQLNLQPIVPQPLRGRPPVFPQLVPRRPLSSRPLKSSTVSPLSMIPTVVPQGERPISIEAPASSMSSASRHCVQLAGVTYRTLRCVAQRFGSPKAAYTHSVFSAHRDGAAPADDYCLHLIGGADLAEPPSAFVRERLESLVAHWPGSQDGAQPLGVLTAAGEVSPEGPFAILLPVTCGELIWSELATNRELSPVERTGWARALVRCLSRLVEQIPEFVHGELGPHQLILSAPDTAQGSRVQLRFGNRLDWLFEDAAGLPASTAPISMARSLYMAPECIVGGTPTSASDVFGVAALIYELLGGDLSVAGLKLRDGGRLPPLAPSAASEALFEALVAAMQRNPLRRPHIGELLRAFEKPAEVAVEPCGVAIAVPPPGQSLHVADSGGRALHLHTSLIDRLGDRGPLLLPFSDVEQLLPAPITVSLFRHHLAVELAYTAASSSMRMHLYPRGSGCTNRLFLNEESDEFEVGSRIHNLLQRIEYRAFAQARGSAEVAEVIVAGHRLQLPTARCAALLWTREQRTGDLYICSIELRN